MQGAEVIEDPPWLRLVEAQPPTVVRPPASTRRVVGQFVAASVVTAILLIAGGVWISRAAAREEAIDDARRTADLVAGSIVTPALREGLLTGDPAAVAKMDEAVRGYLSGDSQAVRVKIWSPRGKILYSDETRLIGSTYPLGSEELEALEHGETEAELSDLAGPENRFERELGRQLLEVYRPIRSPQGDVLLFEMYARYEDVTISSGTVWRRFAPITIGGLLLLQVLQLPLAWRMMRQLQEAQTERVRLLHRAAAASDDERRRIAGNLHDGVVQDLAGASFLLAGAIENGRSGKVEATAALDPALHAVRESIAGLRSLLVEIYPPNLAQAGLPAALAGAVVPLTSRGVTVTASVDDDLRLPPAVEALIFRVAQEALRNVAKHSRASAVELRVDVAPDVVTLLVRDDGVGFDPAVLVKRRTAGHFGLSVLTDLARDAGASLDVSTAPDRGARLRMEVPRS